MKAISMGMMTISAIIAHIMEETMVPFLVLCLQMLTTLLGVLFVVILEPTHTESFISISETILTCNNYVPQTIQKVKTQRLRG